MAVEGAVSRHVDPPKQRTFVPNANWASPVSLAVPQRLEVQHTPINKLRPDPKNPRRISELQIEYVPIEKLNPAACHLRRMSEEELAALERSLSRSMNHRSMQDEADVAHPAIRLRAGRASRSRRTIQANASYGRCICRAIRRSLMRSGTTAASAACMRASVPTR